MSTSKKDMLSFNEVNAIWETSYYHYISCFFRVIDCKNSMWLFLFFLLKIYNFWGALAFVWLIIIQDWTSCRFKFWEQGKSKKNVGRRLPKTSRNTVSRNSKISKCTISSWNGRSLNWCKSLSSRFSTSSSRFVFLFQILNVLFETTIMATVFGEPDENGSYPGVVIGADSRTSTGNKVVNFRWSIFSTPNALEKTRQKFLVSPKPFFILACQKFFGFSLFLQGFFFFFGKCGESSHQSSFIVCFAFVRYLCC